MKNKDYYFRHDYNPTNDPKIICLLGNYGGLGYGIFWRIVEMLHQEKDYKLPLKKYIFEAIAKQMLTNAEQIETIIQECINTYELFATDSNFFWSNRVLDNINKQQEISNVRSLAGRAGAIAKQNQAKQAKERKGKERKYNTADKSAEEFPLKEKKESPKMTETNFETFWGLYPRHAGVSKKLAYKNFMKLSPDKLPIILEAVKKQILMEQWQNPKFIPHPATWLNQERWEDQVEQANINANERIL